MDGVVDLGAFEFPGDPPPNIPDLIGAITKVKVKEKDDGFKLIVKLEVCNRGIDIARGPFQVALYLSDNDTLEKDKDRLLDSFPISKIESDQCKQSTKRKRIFKVRGFAQEELDGRFSIIALDDSDVIPETNEGNNIWVREVSN